jgi:hypothetical protein
VRGCRSLLTCGLLHTVGAQSASLGGH